MTTEFFAVDVCVIILTFNESRHIARAIDSIRPFAKEIIVVDSYSDDGTVELAKALGATVLQNKFINQAKQFQWAMDNAPINSKWIMRLDADEVVESDLVAEIKAKLPALSERVVGVNLKRKHIFMNKWVRYGGRYPLLMLRLWRVGYGRVEDRWMDEHVVVLGGEITTFEGGFADHNLNNLTYFIDKHNKYAVREAIEVISQRLNLLIQDKALNKNSASFQAAFKRFIKVNIYNRIPFTVGALLYFLWRYFCQLGFLDGRSGLVYHFLQGFWYRFLVGAKVMELELEIANLTDKQEILTELSRLTGHKLN
ncbi:MAG: glycosyl transferase [Pseudomonas sp. PGPPP3]|nr:MAG: glycosyl transferase [Pseudomonas sp. PGPPP3]